MAPFLNMHPDPSGFHILEDGRDVLTVPIAKTITEHVILEDSQGNHHDLTFKE